LQINAEKMEKLYADICCNLDFLEVRTMMAYGIEYLPDPSGEDFFIPLNESYAYIGGSLKKVLKSSKALLNCQELEKTRDLIREQCASRIEGIIKKYGYKNKSDLYKTMQSCFAIMCDDKITLEPSKHSRLGWGGMPESCNIVIPSSSSPEITGAAVKYSIACCTGKGADLVAKKLFPGGVPDTFENYLKSLNLQQA
jgi:hypothetical protein